MTDKQYKLNEKEPKIVRGTNHELIDASGVEQVQRKPKIGEDGQIVIGEDGTPVQVDEHIALPRFVITFTDLADPSKPNALNRWGTNDEATLRKIISQAKHALTEAARMRAAYAKAHPAE